MVTLYWKLTLFMSTIPFVFMFIWLLDGTSIDYLLPMSLANVLVISFILGYLYPESYKKSMALGLATYLLHVVVLILYGLIENGGAEGGESGAIFAAFVLLISTPYVILIIVIIVLIGRLVQQYTSKTKQDQ